MLFFAVALEARERSKSRAAGPAKEFIGESIVMSSSLKSDRMV